MAKKGRSKKKELADQVRELTGIEDIGWEKLSAKDLSKLIDIFGDMTSFVAGRAADRVERRIDKRVDQVRGMSDKVLDRVSERPVMGPLLEYVSSRRRKGRKDREDDD